MQSSPRIDCRLTDEQIDVAEISVLDEGQYGAVVTFAGITRPDSHPIHGNLISLQYECYETLAMNAMREIATDAMEQFPVLAIRIVHSTTDVLVGQPSVVIVVGGSHRAETFDACRFLIDALKNRVAIWKKEQWEFGTTWNQGKVISKHE